MCSAMTDIQWARPWVPPLTPAPATPPPDPAPDLVSPHPASADFCNIRLSTVRLHWMSLDCQLSDDEYLDNIRLSTVMEILRVDATRECTVREILKVMTKTISTVREILKVNARTISVTVNQYLDKLPFFSVWPSSNLVKSVFLQTDLRILGNV